MIEIERDEDNRIIIWLDAENYKALSDALMPVQRIAWTKLLDKGYDNLVLDYPDFKVIAAFKGFEDLK